MASEPSGLKEMGLDGGSGPKVGTNRRFSRSGGTGGARNWG